MTNDLPWRLHPEVAQALARGLPVVALESTVITHGLPAPENLVVARTLEATVRRGGALPATIAILGGTVHVGLDGAQLEYLARCQAHKASLWNLGYLCAEGADAGTTVAATLHLAHQAGIAVFATGGIGGVHREPFDESADLVALARYPLVTVCAGPKSVLDAAATLERLESLGVPVIGYRSDKLAGFYLPQTELKLPARCESASQIAACFAQHRRLGLTGGILVSKPVSAGLDPEALAGWLAEAHRRAQSQVSGKDVTPFLLSQLAELSGGATVDVNLRLLTENAALAAEIAVALTQVPKALS